MGEQPQVAHIDSWQAAEINAATWMRFWGHTDAQLTDAGADGGIDVWSSSALGQVKFEAAQVGAPAVQRLVGAAGREGHKQLFFFSGAGYSQQALTYADSMGVALFRYDLLGRMTPANETARFITQMPHPDAARPSSPSGSYWGSSASAAVSDHLSYLSPPHPGSRTHDPHLAQLPDEDAVEQEVVDAIVNFPRAEVDAWATATYHASPKPSPLARILGRRAPRTGSRSAWSRRWPWIASAFFAVAMLGNMTTTETAATAEHPIGTVNPASPSGAFVCFLIAAAFGALGWHRRRRQQRVHTAAVAALTTNATATLPPQVDYLMRNLPWVDAYGWPSTPAQYERVRLQLVQLTESGFFATEALVWGYFVHPQTGVNLREWIDSRARREPHLTQAY